MNIIPQELDWVSKRAECSAGQMFNELVKGIHDDVAMYNKAKDFTEQHVFGADMTRDGKTIMVGQHGNSPLPCVAISIVGEKIIVRDNAKQTEWSVEVKLNREGRCILRLKDETEMEQWQFRKKALEGLFFGD